jgi:hypothetical protein
MLAALPAPSVATTPLPRGPPVTPLDDAPEHWFIMGMPVPRSRRPRSPTIDAFTTVIAIYAGVVTLAALGCFVLVKARPPALDAMVYVLEGGLALRAMLGIAAMVSGRHAVPGTTHIAYLVCSVAILPVMLGTLVDDRSRWSAAVIAVACLAILVIAVRLEMTWSSSA